MPELMFQVLGPLSASYGGRELDLGSRQQRAVLAALLLARGRHVATDSLIDALWGDRAPRTAAGTVRNYISRLRHRLPPDREQPDQNAIELIGDGYTLRLGSALLDLDVFETLTKQARAAHADGDPGRAAALFRDALALGRGNPLAGLPGPYAEAQRARIAEQYMAAAEDGLAAEIASGDHLVAVPQLQELRAAHPLRERLSELLMLALYRSGRQAEALGVFDSSRRVLRDELGIDPGPSLREMHRRILEADKGLAAPDRRQTADAPSGPASSVTPMMLPSPLPDFTGRVHDLSAITAELTDPANASPMVAICGMPGIGKTALAVQAALAVTHDYPDGQLFAELSELEDTAATAASIVGGFLWAMGAATLPSSLFEPTVAWRAALRGRRMIIVLDDLQDPAQIRRLLPPPPGCAVVVTTRRSSLDLPGVRRFEISRLRLDESLRLLARLIGTGRVAAEQAAAEELVNSCARHPLAIRALGARLAMRPTWELAGAARQLREELAGRVDRELVEARLESAYSRLTAAEAEVFRQASLGGDGSVSVAATAVALGISEHATRAALDALAEVHLVEAGTVYGDYRYDPLVGVYARRKAFALDGPQAARAIPA